MKKVILTFDYELFFGERSGTVDKSIIRPTEQLLTKLEEIGGKATFFVDYLMIKYMKENKDTKNDANKITNQLQKIVRLGHRIELHLHPHWIDARYKGDGTWEFKNYTHYSLSSLSEDEVIELFREGTNMLNEIAQTVDPQYKVAAFRAGGWAIQPFSHVRKAFREAGIRIDSSVSAGFYYRGQDSFYDFRNIPAKVWYRFTEDVTNEAPDGEFIEKPISSYKYTSAMRMFNRIHRFISPAQFRKETDGTHSRVVYGMMPSKIKKRGTILSRYTLSRISPYVLLYALKRDKREMLVFLDHPKDFTPSALKILTLMAGKVRFGLI